MKLAIIFIVLLCTNFIAAQQGTPLFQVVTSELTNQRAPVLRELQDELNKLNNENIAGVDLQILEKKVEELKKRITPYIQPITFQIEGDKFSLDYGEKKLLSNSNESLNFSLDSLNHYLKNEISKIIQSIKTSISSRIKSNNTSNVLFYISYEFIDKGGINSINYSNSIPYEIALSNSIGDRIINEIKSLLLNIFSEDQFSKNIGQIIGNEKEKINDKLNDLYNSYNNWFINIFDEAKLFVKDKIEKPLSQNLKGLTGLSVRDGAGTFSGGILYSFRTSVNLKLSLYSNLNFNDGADSSVFSLFGAKLSWAPGNWQFDWLFSSYWGNKEYKAFQLFEGGISISKNFGGNLVMGLAGFYIFNSSDSNENIYSAGLYFKISDSSPAVTVGISGKSNTNKMSPIFQIHYPLNVSL